jgi:hypothetical protein
MMRNRVEIPPLPQRNPRSRETRTQRALLEESIRSHASVLGLMREDLGELHGLAALATLVDDLLVDSVADARIDGYSWAQIGEAAGMTRQAAQQRYGKRVLGAGVGNLRAEGGG